MAKCLLDPLPNLNFTVMIRVRFRVKDGVRVSCISGYGPSNNTAEGGGEGGQAHTHRHTYIHTYIHIPIYSANGFSHDYTGQRVLDI